MKLVKKVRRQIVAGGGGGTLARIGQEIIVPQIYGAYGGANSYYVAQGGSGAHILNSSTDGAYVIGKVPENFSGKTITKAYIYLTSVDASGDLDITIGKTFDSSGDPSTVADSATVNFPTSGSARIVQVTFATGMAVARGDTLFLGILTDTAQVRVLYNNRNATELVGTRAWVNTAGSYADSTVCPVAAFECSDGTVGCLDGNPWVLNGNTTTTYNQNQGIANQFTAPKDVRVVGIWNALNNLVGAFDGSADWLLLDESGSTLASKTVASRTIIHPANKNGIARQYFADPVDISEGDVFHTGVMHTDASGEFRPYLYGLQFETTYQDALWKTVPGHDEWAVEAFIFDAGSLVSASSKYYMHAVGPIISHI